MDEETMIATPESFLLSRSVTMVQASNGLIVHFNLPCRVFSLGEELPKGIRSWSQGRFVYGDWPKAREAINNYMLATPKDLVGMARVAFFEREADMAQLNIQEE